MFPKLCMIAVAGLLVTGCAGTVVRKDAPNAASPSGVLKVRTVAVSVSSKAKEQLPDNLKFDVKALVGTVERALTASDLLGNETGNSLDVEVTNVYVRGTFSAVMFGALAGVDNISGNVRVLDANGMPLRTFEISAGYGFGGWAGGQDSIRINYLYEKFAELTRDQLRDQK